jgi:hypothetical protein
MSPFKNISFYPVLSLKEIKYFENDSLYYHYNHETLRVKPEKKRSGLTRKQSCATVSRSGKTGISDLNFQEANHMSLISRILIAAGILALDSVLFFLPLCAIFLAYVLLVNPPWFRSFLNGLDQIPGKPSP